LGDCKGKNKKKQNTKKQKHKSLTSLWWKCATQDLMSLNILFFKSVN
jgi:hypothetical protein